MAARPRDPVNGAGAKDLPAHYRGTPPPQRELKELIDFVTFHTTESAAFWGGDAYRFSDVYQCPGETILGCLSLPGYRDQAALTAVMNTIYTVKNAPPTYATGPAVEVRRGE